MRKIWVVVANSSTAKIYVNNAHKLVEKKSLEHIESHLRDQDLVSDAPGETTSLMSYGPHPMAQKTPPRVKERHLFGDQVVDFLEKGLKAGEFERLYLIANSAFLGYLRQILSEHVRKLIALEIPKDLTHLKPEEIREYLPPVL